jgi:dipeptidase
MVAEIRKDTLSTIWLTGTSHPCMSLYLPFYFGTDWNQDLFSPTAHPDQSLWWRVKKIQQSISKNYSVLQPKWKNRLDQLQSILIVENESLLKGNPDKQKLSLFMEKCLNDYLEVIHLK